MFIVEKLKLNKFRECSIPKPCDYFKRLGSRSLPVSQYSGDEMIKEGNKIDNLAYMDEFDKQRQSEENSKNE